MAPPFHERGALRPAVNVKQTVEDLGKISAAMEALDRYAVGDLCITFCRRSRPVRLVIGEHNTWVQIPSRSQRGRFDGFLGDCRVELNEENCARLEEIGVLGQEIVCLAQF